MPGDLNGLFAIHSTVNVHVVIGSYMNWYFRMKSNSWYRHQHQFSHMHCDDCATIIVAIATIFAGILLIYPRYD